MKYDDLIGLTAQLPYFDLATLLQLTDEARGGMRTQLHRWMKAGRLIGIRRGMYALPDRYRGASINPAALANDLYRPSYLSGLWALGFYGLIPEKVETFTSVTTRTPRAFENPFGRFDYRHVKRSGFFGYRSVSIRDATVVLADPAKALLDYWHLEPGEWGEVRMIEMRFQNHDVVDQDALESQAERFESPRLLRAVSVWRRLAASEREGTVVL